MASTSLSVDQWITEWIQVHGDRVVGFAYLSTHDWHAAQDIAQEAFLKLYKWGKRHGSEPSVGFLYRIVAHLCVDESRKHHPIVLADPEIVELPQDSELRVDVLEALIQLSDLDRTCLVLFHLEDWSIKDVSAQMGLSEGAVRTRLHRARDRFRALWRDDKHGSNYV